MSERIHIFSNGFEWDNWESVNCSRCVKEPTCGLLNVGIAESFIDGTFDQGTADRMGWSDELRGTLRWRCAEFSDEPIVRAPKPVTHVMRDAGAPMLPGLEVEP